MGNLVFLLFALAVSVIGILLLRLRHRGSTKVSSGVDEFSRGMQAIAPIDDRARRSRGW